MDNFKQDMHINLPYNKEMIVHNVPYTIVYDSLPTVSLGVSLKLEMIRYLILQDEIPEEVDFDDVADLEFFD